MEDFYFLKITQVNSLSQLFNVFVPSFDSPYRYRPIGQQLLFFLIQGLFGLNIYPFLIVIFTIHIANAILLNKLLYQNNINGFNSFFLCLLFISSPLFFTGLYSLTTAHFIIGLFFFLVSFLTWGIPTDKSRKKYFLSFLFFTCALFSSEFSACLPFILVIVKKLPLKKIYLFLPHVVFIFIKIILDPFIINPNNVGDHQLSFNTIPQIMQWFLFRALGLPEGIKNGNRYEIYLIVFLFVLLMGIIAVNIYYKLPHIKSFGMKIYQYFLWIMIGCFPFLSISSHLNPIYFSISFIAIIFIMEKLLSRKFLMLYTIVFLIMSFFSIRLLAHTHWMARRAKLSKSVLNTPRELLNNTVTLFSSNQNDEDELRVTLLGDTAYQAFYRNYQVRTNYEIIKK